MCSEDGAPDRTALHVRRNVRRKIVAGDVQGARSLLSKQFPAFTTCDAGTSGRELDAYFHISCQHFIELIRGNHIDEAVTFAQQVRCCCALLRFLQRCFRNHSS